MCLDRYGCKQLDWCVELNITYSIFSLFFKFCLFLCFCDSVLFMHSYTLLALTYFSILNFSTLIIPVGLCIVQKLSLLLCCRKMRWRSGPSLTAPKNTLETALWSDARPSSMPYVFWWRVLSGCLLFLFKVRQQLYVFQGNYSDVPLFMRIAFGLAFYIQRILVCHICSWVSSRFEKVLHQMWQIAQCGRVKDCSAVVVVPLQNNQHPSPSLWDFVFVPLTYITNTQSFCAVHSRSCSSFLQAIKQPNVLVDLVSLLAVVWQVHTLIL